MKTNAFKSFVVPFVIIINLFTLSSCFKDSCEQTYHYTKYTPIYMSEEELRQPIETEPAIDLVNVGKMFYQAPYLYVNELNEGIHIINNADPSNPQNISFINIPGNIDIAVYGNILYADSYIDLVVLDISDPLNIVEIDRQLNVFPNREYLGFTGDPSLGVVVDFTPSDVMITEPCDSPGDIVMIGNESVAVNSTTGGGKAPTPGIGITGSTTRFAIVGDYLYCVTPESLELFDIIIPSSPQPGSSLNLFSNVETIFPYNDYLFIGTTTGVKIYNNIIPEAPVYVSVFEHSTSCDPVVVQGDYAYSTLRSGTFCGTFTNQLDIIDISNINNPDLVKTYNMTNPWGLGIDEEKLFICDGISGLKYYDVSDPMDIELLQTVNIINPVDVVPIDNLLIVTAENGLYQYDYSTGILIELSKMVIVKDI